MTNLVLRDPITNMLPLFNRQISQFFNSPLSFDNGLLNSTMGPAVTVYETPDSYVFQAELPGWKRDQISINFENQTLILSGQRDLPQEEGWQYHRVEGLWGSFSRSFTVPGIVDPNKVEAELREGVLVITLPKREEAKPRHIEVKAVQ